MKKHFFLLIFLGLSVFFYSQEVDLAIIESFSIGGAALFYNDFDGGYMDTGFNLVHTDDHKFNVRNHIQIGGGVDAGVNMQLFLRERIVFGFSVPLLENFSYRHYYAIDFGTIFVQSKKSDKTFFDLPIVLEFRIAAGSDFIIKSKSAFFIETGIGVRVPTSGNLETFSEISKLKGFISIGKKGHIKRK